MLARFAAIEKALKTDVDFYLHSIPDTSTLLAIYNQTG
jgi:hypothetical protein